MPPWLYNRVIGEQEIYQLYENWMTSCTFHLLVLLGEIWVIAPWQPYQDKSNLQIAGFLWEHVNKNPPLTNTVTLKKDKYNRQSQKIVFFQWGA